jgi:mono/diheme cytochrome c family protein
MRGAVLYQNCGGCHGTDPETGVLGIYKGTTASVLEAAYRRVGVMNRFTTSLTAANNSDLAAFIKSRVSP